MVVRINCEGEISTMWNLDLAFIDISAVPFFAHDLTANFALIGIVKNYICTQGIMALTKNCGADWNFFSSNCFHRNEISPEENNRGDINYWDSIDQPEPSVLPASAERTSKMRYLLIASVRTDAFISPALTSSERVATTIDSASTLK